MHYIGSNINDKSSLTFCIYPTNRLIFLNQQLLHKAIWIDKLMDEWMDGWMNIIRLALVHIRQLSNANRDKLMPFEFTGSDLDKHIWMHCATVVV